MRFASNAARWMSAAAATAMMLGVAAPLLAQQPAVTTASNTQSTINPGPIKGERRHVESTRGTTFCTVAAFIGKPANATAHIYTSTSCQTCSPEYTKSIDPAGLARQIGVAACRVNAGRFWMMDELIFSAGESVSLHGVTMVWIGSLKPEDAQAYFGDKPYTPASIARESEWIFKAGKPVYLLRTPDGKAWVLQEFCHDADTDLTPDNLDTLGKKLRLPTGWRFETNILPSDLSLNTARSGGRAFIMRDELGNTYQGVGFDDSASYIPSVATAAETPIPESKQTTLGLYVTAAEAYDRWKAAPESVKIIDVRTPEEYVVVGHPAMALNIPFAFLTYQQKEGKFEYGSTPNTEFVSQLQKIAKPNDMLLVACRSGGRSAKAVNLLAAAGFTNVYNIVDGIEGDMVKDHGSAFYGKRMKNGWKNSAPWVYDVDPEKIILEEGATKTTTR